MFQNTRTSGSNGSVENGTGSGTPGASCPVTVCPDYSGPLPSCAGLSVPYVPFQQNNPQKYSQTDALSNGTLFPGLNLPFHLKVDAPNAVSGPLGELQALEFVLLELGLYLDTHQADAEAFAMFQQYVALERSAKQAYEEKYGPLTRSAAASGESYQWLKDPWPWNFAQNEVN